MLPITKQLTLILLPSKPLKSVISELVRKHHTSEHGYQTPYDVPVKVLTAQDKPPRDAIISDTRRFWNEELTSRANLTLGGYPFYMLQG